MLKNYTQASKCILLLAVLGSFAVSRVAAQSAAAGTTARTAVASTYHPNRFSRRADLHYGLVWGIDSLSVKWAESGEMIRFSYRVLDAQKAATLNDKKVEPTLIDAQARVSLVIPALEKVGKLRQTSTPIDGRSYWMAFSNKGGLVKRGDRVTVMIGQFRAEGLVVD